MSRLNVERVSRRNSLTKKESNMQSKDKEFLSVGGEPSDSERRRMSFRASVSSTMRSGKRSPARKRGHIFKTADKLKFIESKGAFRDLLGQNKILNDKLQEKINYYYTPYQRKNMNTHNTLMRFGTITDLGQEAEEDSKGQDQNYRNFDKRAKRMWKNIVEYVTSKDTERTRQFLRNINPELYTKLKNFGQQYYIREFKEDARRESFPDIENPHVLGSKKEDILLKSEHTDNGIKVLKNQIDSKILTSGFTYRSSKSISKSRSKPNLRKKSDIVTPLVMLFRGNQEIKKKKRFYRNRSQNEIKELTTKEGKRELSSLFTESPQAFTISMNPETKKLEYEDSLTQNHKLTIHSGNKT
mmetsp:Transcript_12158/g.12160  ORF Transcript_12158/g.12160 Transcript_12158/m.12160 type:complete len:356 (+) Transcript_12158:3-1070(+)